MTVIAEDGTMRIDEDVAESPVVHLAGFHGPDVSLTRFQESLVPDDGLCDENPRSARFRATIELTEGSPEATIEEAGDVKTVLVKPVTCGSIGNSEHWFDIYPDTNFDDDSRLGELVLKRTDLLPDWVAEEGDRGTVRIELRYDEEATLKG